jgi:zinc protease
MKNNLAVVRANLFARLVANKFATATWCGLAAAIMLAAAPASMTLRLFAPATEQRLPNGVLIASQPQNDLPLIGAQIFLPAGLAQQATNKAGVAAISAALVLETPVEGSTTLEDAVQNSGGSISYTLDPLDTRFYLECRDADFARLLHDFRTAIADPDISLVESQRTKTLALAQSMGQNPIEVAYTMVRQVNYDGTGFAMPDQGNPLTVARLSRADVAAFAGSYGRANGTIVALTGAVSQAALDAASREFGSLTSGVAARPPTVKTLDRAHEVVAHRTVSSSWVAVAYQAPDQYSSDFATMLVIEALLGGSGGVDSFSFSSASPTPDDYVGAYYEYEASPGSMIVFLGGDSSNLDQSVRDLETGITRLRGDTLSESLIDEAKRTALGDYYASAATLAGQAWLLARSAASPQGLAFENMVPQRILAVKGDDVQRVARRYLTKETVAIVLPAQEQ